MLSQKLQAVWRKIPSSITCSDLFSHLYATAPSAFWIDNPELDGTHVRWSYMGEAVAQKQAPIFYNQTKQPQKAVAHAQALEHEGGIFSFLKNWQASRRSPQAQLKNPPPYPFTGGYLGWFGYELNHASLGSTAAPVSTPDAFFFYVDHYLVFDHAMNEMCAVAIDTPENMEHATAWVEKTLAQVQKIQTQQTQTASFSPNPAPVATKAGALLTTTDAIDAAADTPTTQAQALAFSWQRQPKQYLRDVAQCLEWIRNGVAYQVCLTNTLSCQTPHQPLQVFLNMRELAPAPYAAFIRHDKMAVQCASPELFLSLNKTGLVTAKPIKGTAARATTCPKKDAQRAQNLQTNAKDRAENVMIVDLLRNDLGRVCTLGSIHVPKLFHVETYTAVHQLVSTIQGQLQAQHDGIDLVQACFPGGSMTGAPKIKAMELIQSLEKKERGVYSGSIGWLGNDGAIELNIVIRTIVSMQDHISIGVGGGIVSQSNPQGEYEEMCLKAQNSLCAIAQSVIGDSQHYDIQAQS